jgi:hypothetical protein
VAGKAKKKRLNGCRYRSQVPPAATRQPDIDPQETPLHQPAADASPVTVASPLGKVVLDESSLANSPILPYVRMVVSLIEGVRFTCREVLDLLRQALRQHRFGVGHRSDYLRGFLHPHPP